MKTDFEKPTVLKTVDVKYSNNSANGGFCTSPAGHQSEKTIEASGVSLVASGFKEYGRLCSSADLYQYRCAATNSEWKSCSYEFARDNQGVVEVRALKIAADDIYLSPPDVAQVAGIDQSKMNESELKVFKFAAKRIRKQAFDDTGDGYFSAKDAASLLKIEKREARAILDDMCSRSLLRVSEFTNGIFYRSIDRLGFEVGHIKINKEGGND
jgi:hypothetical protein